MDRILSDLVNGKVIESDLRPRISNFSEEFLQRQESSIEFLIKSEVVASSAVSRVLFPASPPRF